MKIGIAGAKVSWVGTGDEPPGRMMWTCPTSGSWHGLGRQDMVDS